MDAEFNYKSLFDQAVQRIRGIRDPHSTRPETIDLKWDEVRKQVLFDFGGTEFEKYSSVLDAAFLPLWTTRNTPYCFLRTSKNVAFGN